MEHRRIEFWNMNKIEFNGKPVMGLSVIFKASEIKWRTLGMKVALSFQLFRADC